MEKIDTDYIRNILKEIQRELNTANVTISNKFLLYYVNLLLLNPVWQININSPTNREYIQIFIQHVVKRLRQQESAEMITLKIQESFLNYFETREDIVRNYRKQLLDKLLPLKQNILKIDTMSKGKMDNFYKKITCYCVLASGLGNPVLEYVYNEALTALKSILFPNEIDEFIKQPKNVKEAQLDEFVDLVAGVRLFNRDCGKGGHGIEDLPDLLKLTLDNIFQHSHTLLLSAMEKINALTTAIDHFHNSPTNSRIKQKDIKYLINLLVVYRQYELLIRKFITEIENETQTVDDILMSLNEKLKKLHETVYMRIAIPASIVFPHFIVIFDSWRNLQNKIVCAKHLNELLQYISNQVSELNYPNTTVDAIIGNEEPLTDAERLLKTSEEFFKSDNPDIAIINLDGDNKIEKYQFQFLGFCSEKLLQTDGGLIPGNPNLGICHYKNKNYVFSTLEAAQQFLQDPKNHINTVLSLLREKPHLINFLQAKQLLMEVRDILNLAEKPKDVKCTNDSCVQTETHPIPTRIIPEYKWNIWDLKREALKLADLSRCKTVSTQTYKIFYKCPIRVQTYEPKEKASQTKTDNCSNVPKPSRFLFGLRGRTDDGQFAIDLTRPVDE